ncbi:MAG TPA: DUF4260 domain-containing protein [Herpetosiphonaceae bacterium]
MPGLLLRIEGLSVLIAAGILYGYQSYSWLIFALLLLAPDLSMLGYLFGQNAGGISYNLFHTYALPLSLALISFVIAAPLGIQLALIWLAHIGMDRAVGYGLKYATGFKDTHLERV